MDYGLISVYDIKTGTLRDIRLSEDYYLNSCVTANGNIAVVSSSNIELGGDFKHAVTDCFTPDGTLLWSKELPANVRSASTFVALIKSHQYANDSGEHSDLVITIESEAFTLDEKDGSLISSLTLPGEATALSVTIGGPYGRVGYRQGDFDLIDFSEGRIYSDHTFRTEESIKTWVVLKEQMAYVSSLSTEVHVVSWHEAPDIEDYVTYKEKMIPAGVSSDGSVYAVRPDLEYQTYIFMNADGSEACRYEGDAFVKGMKLTGSKAYIWDSKKMTILDTATGTKETIVPGDHGYSDFSVEFTLNRNATGCIFWSSQHLMVFDLEKKEVICEYSPEETIGSMLLSDDKSRIYIADSTGRLCALDTATCETHAFKDENLKIVAEGYYKDIMALCPDQKSLALCCADGTMRVANTASFETVATVPLESYLRSYISYTDDGSHIVVQGDDYRIRIFDTKTGAYVTTIDGNGSIDHIVCDEDSHLMAVSTGMSLFLFETEGYGCVAYAEDGLEYLKGNDSILVSMDGIKIRRTYYKNYKKLMEEAKKQFPNATLTAEKRAQYNID